MKIEWIRNKNNHTYRTDITELVESVRWGGSVSQVARTAEIRIVNAPNDKNVLNLAIESGQVIKLYEDEKMIFLGEIITKESASETGATTYFCVDLLNHLLKSAGIYNFSNTTAEKITKKVCADFKVATGKIKSTGVPIKKMIIDGDSIYDIIMKAYTKAAKQTGKKYICRMRENKLVIEEKGAIAGNFILAEGYNITNIRHEETIENMVNVVKIYDKAGKQIGEVKKDEWIKKYGIYQQIYKKEAGINEIAAAQNMLKGMGKKVELDGIDGDLSCVAGNGVEVYDKFTKLNGIFWIESDNHTWEKGIHTMSLELSFKNIMDKKNLKN